MSPPSVSENMYLRPSSAMPGSDPRRLRQQRWKEKSLANQLPDEEVAQRYGLDLGMLKCLRPCLVDCLCSCLVHLFLSCRLSLFLFCCDAKDTFPEFLKEMYDNAHTHPDGKSKRRHQILSEAGADDLCVYVCRLMFGLMVV